MIGRHLDGMIFTIYEGQVILADPE